MANVDQNDFTQLTHLDKSWQTVLGAEFEQAYMRDLRVFLAAEKAEGKVIYPAGKHVYAAFN